jgi:NAD(P)H dehydrogenase (quinone)
MMPHWGAIIAAPGYTDPVFFASGGNPYGVGVSVDSEGMKTDVKEAVIPPSQTHCYDCRVD